MQDIDLQFGEWVPWVYPHNKGRTFLYEITEYHAFKKKSSITANNISTP